MIHASCIDAIQSKRQQGDEKANVSAKRDECACDHVPTECKWIGHDKQYACLSDKSTVPQRVYTHMNGTKMSKLEPRR